QGLFAARGRLHFVAPTREIALQRDPHRGLVVDDQDVQAIGDWDRGRHGGVVAGGARGDDRQLDHEAGTLGRVFRPDAPLVLAYDAERDREPEARARAGGFGGEEGIEDALEEVGRDPGAGVFDVDTEHVARAPRAHREPLLVALRALHRLLGVGDQVQEYLLQLVRVRHRSEERRVGRGCGTRWRSWL